MRIGRFEVLGEIARGGMGAVLRAHDPARQRDVALKLLLEGAHSSPARRRRFQTECQALMRVRHPNVVALLDSGEHEGCPWLAMDLIEGTSLAQRIERGGPFEPREAARVTKLLADALQHLHERGVLHRDVKPANVLITPEGRTLLTDFGLAKDLRADPAAGVSLAGQFLGTPGYAAPEQAQLGEVDARADVYGLGASLYAMLTGRAPWDARDVAELMAAQTQPPRPPSQLREGIDAGLEAICLRCLAHDPAARWPSAEALSAALGDWIRGGDPGPAGGRGRAALPLLGVLVAGLAGLGAWLSLGPPGPQPRPDRPAPLAQEASASAAVPSAGVAAADSAGAQGELRAQARAAEGAKDWPAAAAAWTRLLRLAPGDRQALFGRAVARIGQGDRLGAEEDLGRAIERHPGDVDLRLTRAELLRGRDPAAAVRDLDAAVAAAPGDPDVWLGRAALRRAAGDAAGALQDLDRCLALDPDRLRGLDLRADLHLERGELQQALSDWQRAAGLRPDLATVWINLSVVHSRLGDPRAALAALDRACSVDLSNAGAHARRATVRLALEDPAGAEADLRRAAELEPLEGEHVARLVQLLAERGRAGEALAAVEAALLRLPGEPTLLACRGHLRYDAGAHQAAYQDLTASLEREPDRAGRWVTRALVRLAMRDLPGALADTDRALELEVEAQTVVNRGAILEQLGREDEALAEYGRAVELSPDCANGWLGLAQLRFRRKEYPPAVAAMERAVALLPANVRIRVNLGLMRFQAGDREGAGKEWRAARERDPQGEEGTRAGLYLRDYLGEKVE